MNTRMGRSARRWPLAAAALLTAVTLAGCSSNAPTGGGAAVDGWSQDFAGTELHVLAEATLNSIVLEDLLDDFTDKTGIKVVLEQAPYDQVVQKAVLDYTTGKGDYDVVSIPYEYLGGFAGKEYLLPIDDTLKANEGRIGDGFDTGLILPELWKASAEWAGTTYGFPSNAATTMMLYRSDLLGNADEQAAFEAEYGYPLAPATTFAQYRDIAEFFTRAAGETAGGVTLTEPLYGVAIAGKRHIASVLEWMNYSWAYGGDIFDDKGQPAIDSAANVASLKYEMEISKFAPPSFTTSTWDEVTSQLQQGVAVQALTWGDTAGSIEDPESSTVAGKIGYADIPVLEDGGQTASHLGSWTYTINADSENKDASMLFLAWALSEPVQTAIAEAGGLPSLRSVFEDPALVESLPYWSQELQSLTDARSRPRIAEWGALSESLAIHLSEVYAGQAQPGAALADAQKDAESILVDAVPVTEF